MGIFLVVILMLCFFCLFTYICLKIISKLMYGEDVFKHIKQNGKVNYKPVKSASERKGEWGEYKLQSSLKWMEQYGCKFVANPYLPKRNGQTTEVDLILITKAGVFVFESKNYSGWIFGNEADEKWTQTLRNGRGGSYHNTFYNPIKQNRGHIKIVKEYIGNVKIWSVVVFTGNAQLKKVDYNPYDCIVCQLNNLNERMQFILNNSESIYSQEQVDEMYYKLNTFSNVSDDFKYRHVDEIKNH